MKNKSHKLNITNIVATDGFQFSGSGLVNDIFRSSGYKVPKNIRADELFYKNNNFSWPRAINNEYTFVRRMILFLKILKTILIRIPINFAQKTPFYQKYLSLKGRDNSLHQPTSVNRSIWSYFVSIYMILVVHRFERDLFYRWISLKYKWQIRNNLNLLIDNGIPKDKKLVDWFFQIDGSLGIFVYRNPRNQYQQIINVSQKTKQTFPTYSDFLKILMAQYESILWILESDYNILFISFDDLVNNINYRNMLEAFFVKMKIMKKINYDFTESYLNNNFISSQVNKKHWNSNDMQDEIRIHEIHKLFEQNFNKILATQ